MREMPLRRLHRIISVLFAVFCVVYALPLITVVYNAFKTKEGIVDNFFALPNGATFAGLSNFTRGIAEIAIFKSAGYSVVITVVSVLLILVCTSMCAW